MEKQIIVNIDKPTVDNEPLLIKIAFNFKESTLYKWDQQGIDQQNFETKSISLNTTQRQSFRLIQTDSISSMHILYSQEC